MGVLASPLTEEKVWAGARITSPSAMLLRLSEELPRLCEELVRLTELELEPSPKPELPPLRRPVEVLELVRLREEARSRPSAGAEAVPEATDCPPPLPCIVSVSMAQKKQRVEANGSHCAEGKERKEERGRPPWLYRRPGTSLGYATNVMRT